MRSLSNKTGGMTLIEAMIYASLLSFLLAGFIRYAFSLHESDLKLRDNINDSLAK